MKFDRIILFLLTILLIACSNRPKEVLTDKKMEDLLYDLYVAEGEVTTNYPIFGTDSLRKETLFNSVLAKHKVTKTELDASIDWYSDNLDKYAKINKNLSNRFEKDIQSMRDPNIEQVQPLVNYIDLPFIRDSVNFLNPYSLPRNLFSFRSDTALYEYGGIYEVQFNVLGINEAIRSELTFCVECADTTFVRRTQIDKNGLCREMIDITRNKRFREIYGYIHFPETNAQTNVFISDFRLLKQKDKLARDDAALLKERPEDVVPISIKH